MGHWAWRLNLKWTIIHFIQSWTHKNFPSGLDITNRINQTLWFLFRPLLFGWMMSGGSSGSHYSLCMGFSDWEVLVEKCTPEINFIKYFSVHFSPPVLKWIYDKIGHIFSYKDRFNSSFALSIISLNSHHQVSINVSGRIYQVYKDVWIRFHKPIGGRQREEYFDDVTKEYYFDRDPELFRFVLMYYRTGKFKSPSTKISLP